MGIKIELSANSRMPLAPGRWEFELVKFEHGKSGVKKTPYVQPVFKVLDEDAVRVELDEDTGELFTGEEKFTGRVWGDNYWLTSNSLFRLKNLVAELGSELPGEGEEVDDEAVYAQMLTDELAESTVVVQTGIEDYEDKNGDTRYKTVIEEFNV